MVKTRSIALVSAGYPPNIFGGIDMQTYDLAHALSEKGVDVTVFCGGSRVPVIIREKDHLRVCKLPMLEMPPRVLWFQLQNLRFFEKELADYDLVHTQHSSGSFFGLFMKKLGKPWIVSFHDHQLRRFLIPFKTKLRHLSPKDMVYYTACYPLFELFTKMELKWADHYIACGVAGFLDYVKFSGMNPSKTTVIPNGIDVQKIHSIIRSYYNNVEYEKKDDDFFIFTCGRLYSSKGIQFLIKSMPLVLERFKNVKLKIFGRGPLYSKLLTLTRQLNLQTKVCFMGHVPYERLIYEMSKCTLAVFPSLVEVGPSLAVMEAMACRKAVIMFDCPFSREIIKHRETGYLVPPMNTKELAEAICLLLEDEKLRDTLGMKAYSNVLKKHDIRIVVEKYLRVYHKLLSDK
ncbi:MAG: glycosyltransferase family 4 protein [Nitrososphaeria archaeon]